LGAAVAAEEATPKPGAQRPVAKEMHKAKKLAIREQPRGGGHHGIEFATATAKKVTVAAAKIIRGAIAKMTGAPRAAPLVVIRCC